MVSRFGTGPLLPIFFFIIIEVGILAVGNQSYGTVIWRAKLKLSVFAVNMDLVSHVTSELYS